MNNKDLVKNGLQLVLENPSYDIPLIETYFSKNYVQCVDGKRFDYTMFTKHIKKVKELTTKLSIEFNYIAEEGNLVFTNHTVTVIMKDGTQDQVKVIATFIIEDRQIVFCDELTLHLDNHQKTKDLGSVV
ncbi:hypothetical protein [Myroides sp. N17-2]|uniref:hypothetical protein n=1 Tax=Myroides sp. N17-2 TaxID=2030799 RepID=UPI000EFB5C63|nr:hypothetical protein [Myroides sp. N17-2]